MKAPTTSHTVLLEKPESAHFSVSSTSLKPGFANSALPNSTQGASTVVLTTPMRPITGAGNGSVTSPAITPAKMAKKYQACGSSPLGAGSSAMMATMARGTTALQAAMRGSVGASSVRVLMVQSSLRISNV